MKTLNILCYARYPNQSFTSNCMHWILSVHACPTDTDIGNIAFSDTIQQKFPHCIFSSHALHSLHIQKFAYCYKSTYNRLERLHIVNWQVYSNFKVESQNFAWLICLSLKHWHSSQIDMFYHIVNTLTLNTQCCKCK